jgi:hypothetical protein
MWVEVLRRFDEGKEIPRWQWGRLQPKRGILRLEWDNAAPGRWARMAPRTARLLDLRYGRKGPPDVVPPLCDAVVIDLVDDKMTIAGVEHNEGIFPNVAQVWEIRILAVRDNDAQALARADASAGTP